MVVFAASAIGMGLGRLTGRKRKGLCVVLYYHSVPAELRGEFARQLDVVLQKAKTIGVADRVSLEQSNLYAAVTFDDAFENFVDVALPELTKSNCRRAWKDVRTCRTRRKSDVCSAASGLA
jgi:hypothetical protein